MRSMHGPRWYEGTTTERINYAPERLGSFWLDTSDFGLYWWNGSQWNALVPTADAYFLHEEDDPVIAGYEQLLSTPSDDAEVSDTAVCVNVSQEYVIDEYITPANTPGVTVIPGGAWHFTTWCSVDATTGITNIVIHVYKRTTADVETELFNITTDEIDNTSVGVHEIDTVQPDFIIDATDRLVIKYFAISTSVPDRTVTLYYEGNTHYTHVHTPIVV